MTTQQRMLEDAIKAEALELIASGSRELDKLLHLTQKSKSTVPEISEASEKFIDTVYRLELLLRSDEDELASEQDLDDTWEG